MDNNGTGSGQLIAMMVRAATAGPAYFDPHASATTLLEWVHNGDESAQHEAAAWAEHTLRDDATGHGRESQLALAMVGAAAPSAGHKVLPEVQALGARALRSVLGALRSGLLGPAVSEPCVGVLRTMREEAAEGRQKPRKEIVHYALEAARRLQDPRRGLTPETILGIEALALTLATLGRGNEDAQREAHEAAESIATHIAASEDGPARLAMLIEALRATHEEDPDQGQSTPPAWLENIAPEIATRALVEWCEAWASSAEGGATTPNAQAARPYVIEALERCERTPPADARDGLTQVRMITTIARAVSACAGTEDEDAARWTHEANAALKAVVELVPIPEKIAGTREGEAAGAALFRACETAIAAGSAENEKMIVAAVRAGYEATTSQWEQMFSAMEENTARTMLCALAKDAAVEATTLSRATSGLVSAQPEEAKATVETASALCANEQARRAMGEAAERVDALRALRGNTDEPIEPKLIRRLLDPTLSAHHAQIAHQALESAENDEARVEIARHLLHPTTVDRKVLEIVQRCKGTAMGCERARAEARLATHDNTRPDRPLYARDPKIVLAAARGTAKATHINHTVRTALAHCIRWAYDAGASTNDVYEALRETNTWHASGSADRLAMLGNIEPERR